MFNRNKSKLSKDLHTFDYDDLETLINKAEDKVVEITMPDGVRLVIRPAKGGNNSASLSGRFNN